MGVTVKNLIGGEWVEARSGDTFETIDPATEDVIGTVAKAGPGDVNEAVGAAKAAYEGWRLTPAPRRGEMLFRVGQILQERKEVLARLLTREMGKVIAEARGDVQEAIDMAFYMGGEGRRLLGYTAPVELPNKFGMALRDPVGVVGLITPWNFPIAIPSWKSLPALVAGNAVVFKPASDTPKLGTEFGRVFMDAGVPPGVLNVVTGPGSSTGSALVNHPDVKVISFTGSTEVGYKLYAEAARYGKKVSLELGGKNAIIVMDDASFDLAVEAILWSAFGTTGQRCTATSRLIVQKGIAPRLTEALVEQGKALKLGNGLDESVDVGPLINENARKTVHSYVEIGKREGARLLCGGHPADMDKGFFYEVTLFDKVQPDMRIAQEEIFGPVLSIIEFDTLEEAIQINNNTAYGLSSSIFTENVNAAFRAIRDLSTGIVYINHGTIGAEIQFPFGGTRGTGNGMREAGQTALDTFTAWKAVYVDYSGRLQRAQIDTDAILGE
jgi:acyl-CoA reductase-like NAD-dependent aldehyde dehydrogenase